MTDQLGHPHGDDDAVSNGTLGLKIDNGQDDSDDVESPQVRSPLVRRQRANSMDKYIDETVVI
jgi:hypothetical protein